MLNIDLAPTFIDLAGEAPPSTMDGTSFRKALESNSSLGESWRTDFMVEHSGEVQEIIEGCPTLNHQNVAVSCSNTKSWGVIVSHEE